jgi:alkanesulfonate monooxygenase
VVPELQRRGLYRTKYEGTTLRANLGIARPAWHPDGVPFPAVRAAAEPAPT